MIRGALDLSGSAAYFTVFRDEKPLLESSRPMSGRDSAGLADFLTSELAVQSLTLRDIQEWTVGSGPGSFTGLRLAAALVGGLTLNRTDVRVRCIPGAIAMAGALNAPFATVGCLYDGRNKEVIYFGLKLENGEYRPSGTTAVLNAEQAIAFFAACHDDALIALNGELPALAKVLSSEVLGKVHGCEKLNLEKLITAKTFEFNGDLTDLVYIRPAVFV